MASLLSSSPLLFNHVIPSAGHSAFVGQERLTVADRQKERVWTWLRARSQAV